MADASVLNKPDGNQEVILRFDCRQVGLNTPMALDSNAWHKDQQLFLSDNHHHNQQQQQAQPAPQNSATVQTQQRSLLKIPSKTSILTQTERNNCLEGGVTLKNDPVMFDPNLQQQQQQQNQTQNQANQVYNNVNADKKDNAEKSSVAEFPFCYNVNMLQKVHQNQQQQQQQGTSTSTATAAVVTDDKACYRFDVAQPFGYNYALVNQMSLAAAASTATFKCDICGLVFTHLSLLNHHKRIHSNGAAGGNAAANTQTNNGTTNTVNTQTNNATTNTTPQTERTYACDMCGNIFNSTGELKTHKTNVHKVRNCTMCGVEVDCEHMPVGGKRKKFVKCESCLAESGDSNAFQSSQDQSSSSDEMPKPPHPVKRHGMAQMTKCHKCNGSGIIFIGGTRNVADKPYHCNLCDGSFSRYSSLWSHKRLHTGDKPFKCDLCGLTFARAAYLKNHIRVHSGEKPFKCGVCGMQFSQSPHLKNHERIHSGERPYQCEVCEKTFARHSTLWNHRRIHTGEKPYRCGLCGSAFNQATHLKNHAKVHTGEKPHRCEICDVRFSDRFALKRHHNIHEKYGRTAPNNSQNSQQQQPNPQQQQQQQQQQPNPQQQQQQQQQQQVVMEDVIQGIHVDQC